MLVKLMIVIVFGRYKYNYNSIGTATEKREVPSSTFYAPGGGVPQLNLLYPATIPPNELWEEVLRLWPTLLAGSLHPSCISPRH